MLRSSRPLLAALIFGTVLIGSSGQPAPALGEPQPLAELPDWAFETAWEITAIPEPSGLCFHPQRNTIFAVDDGAVDRKAAVFELSLDCEVLAKAEYSGDLEGVCFCPVDGLLYVVDESAERLLALEPAGLTLVGEAKVARSTGGIELMKAGGNGFEGIEYVPEADGCGYLLLLNQDDPYLLARVELATIDESISSGALAEISQSWELPALNAGELHYNVEAGEIWVINSWMNVMQVYEPSTMDLLRWEVVPGAAQEGVTLDSLGRLWIGQDIGGIVRYTWQGD